MSDVNDSDQLYRMINDRFYEKKKGFLEPRDKKERREEEEKGSKKMFDFYLGKS